MPDLSRVPTEELVRAVRARYACLVLAGLTHTPGPPAETAVACYADGLPADQWTALESLVQFCQVHQGCDQPPGHGNGYRRTRKTEDEEGTQ